MIFACRTYRKRAGATAWRQMVATKRTHRKMRREGRYVAETAQTCFTGRQTSRSIHLSTVQIDGEDLAAASLSL